MSGDVQPRRRKDKKRRKDDTDPFPVQVHPTVFVNSPVSDDVNIHVHKEAGTGGNICAKLVFFVLFSALAVLIGLIITEHRGLTDLDSVDSESRYSHIFEGLVDSHGDAHDHGDHDFEEALDSLEVDQVDDQEENEEALDVSGPEDDEETPSQEDHSEERSVEEEEDLQTDEIEEDESAVSEEQEEEDDDEENEVMQNDEEEEDVPAENDEDIVDDDEEVEDTVDESEEQPEDSDEGPNGEVEDGTEEDETGENESEVDETEVDEAGDSIELNDDDGAGENDVGKSAEDEDVEPIKTNMSGETDDDEKVVSSNEVISAEETREDLSGEKQEVVQEIIERKEAVIDLEEIEQDSNQGSSVAVKLGVGIAILVVAHFVLVRKWRTAADDSQPPPPNKREESLPDLSRRNTLIPPPSYQEIEPDLEHDDEDYSDEVSEGDEPIEEKTSKAKYQELRDTYSRSLSPESTPGIGKSHEQQEYEDEENIEEEEEEEISEEDEEEDDYENEEEDEDDDEELLKRLEAKYGKLHGAGINSPQDMVGDSDSDVQSDDDEYKNINITNKEDFQIRDEIDEAQKSIKHNPSYAVKLFDAILQKSPSSPRSLYGKAVSLDALADEKQSNAILEKALELFTGLLERGDVPPDLYRLVADRCMNRMRFIGQYKNLILAHQLIIKRFPDDPKYRNELAVTYLTINRIEDARSVLKVVLKRWPNDGFALVHYGFILKTADDELEEAVRYLREGLKTRAEGVEDGRFYFQLGDALTRLGRTDEANKVYEEGAENKVFLSKYQRSLYNVARLTGKPWWRAEDIGDPLLFDLLKQHWREIRNEGLSVLNEKGFFQDEAENLRDTGDWKQFELYARGRKNAANCRKCPVTCGIIDQIPEARFCKRGQTKFSVMHPGTHVWPHCGPTNCRLRTHLGLRVPQDTFMRVANQTRSWEEGAVIVFDDSFEHEVWHNGTGVRLVLIVDIWHPELTMSEKKTLSAI